MTNLLDAVPSSQGQLSEDTSRVAEVLATGRPRQASEALVISLFDSLRLKNGVYKTTCSHRLDDVNTWVTNYLPAASPLNVLDVAISSGTSTLEWIDSLEESGFDCRMTGMDLTIDALLVSFGDRLHAVLDRTRWPLMFEIDGQFISNPPRKKHLLRYFISLTRIKWALRLWAQQPVKYRTSRTLRILGMPTTSRNINLVIPRLMGHPRVIVREGDLLSGSGLEGEFHVIRAANILNRKYFDNAAIVRMVQNLEHQLAQDGLLVVCRTDLDGEGVNRGTIFKLGEDKRFAPVSQLNGGSEVEELILNIQF